MVFSPCKPNPCGEKAKEQWHTTAQVDEEAPIIKKKKRAPIKPKEVATDNEDIDDAADAKVDEGASVVKKKRASTKSKTKNEDIDDAIDAKVDEEAPVAKKKRAPVPAMSRLLSPDLVVEGDS